MCRDKRASWLFFFAAWVALTLGSGCATTPGYGYGPLEGTPTSEGWKRVDHPIYPVTFEVPKDTMVTTIGWLVPGSPRRKDGLDEPLPIYSYVHEDRQLPLYALDIGIYVITTDYKGVDDASLEALSDGSMSTKMLRGFVRDVFFDGKDDAPIGVQTKTNISGYPAWQVHADNMALTEKDRRPLSDAEIFLVPLDGHSCLLIAGVFSYDAKPRLRREVFPRIMGSMKIEKRSPFVR